MTSRIREASRSRAMFRNGALGLTALALSAGLFCGPVTAASADPALTVADAKAQVTQLETEAAAVDQDYAGVKEQIDTGRAKLTTKQADVKAQTAKVAKMRQQVGQVALAQFQNRDLDTTAQLFLNNDTDGFLSQMSTVEKVSENQNRVLQTFQAEQSTLADLQRSATADLATLTAQETELAGLRAESDKKVAESKAVLAKLTAEERQRIADEEKAAAEAAQRAADKAEKDQKAAAEAEAADTKTSDTKTSDTTTSDTTTDDSTRSDSTSRSADRTTSDTTSTPAGSSKGATAIAFAKQQLGKPYRFGATGPGAFDCSGLTGGAWKAAGVSLPRTSQQQIGAGTAVAKSDLQPGDLVFYYSGITHVGLYVGNGQIIHASRPGKPVGYASVDSMPFAGARRPG